MDAKSGYKDPAEDIAERLAKLKGQDRKEVSQSLCIDVDMLLILLNCIIS